MSSTLLRTAALASASLLCGLALAPRATAAEPRQVRVLVLEPEGDKVEAADRVTFAGLIAAALSRRPEFDVLSSQELARALSHQADKQLAGCTSPACLQDMASLLDAELVVFGDVNRLGALLVFNLTLFDSTRQKPAGRVAVEAKHLEELPSKLRQGIDQLTAAALQDARLGRGEAATGCPAGMVRIPAGQFFMGADDDERDPMLKNAKPSHQVKLKAYCFDVTEVTVDAYLACSSQGKCKRPPTTISWQGISDANANAYNSLCNARSARERGSHPINCVDWNLAKRFCESRGARLPTEAEWEFATRGPDGRRYPWGDDKPTANDLNACGAECAAWAKQAGVKASPLYTDDDGFAGTAPVGSFPAGDSRFGPKDVVGNVLEWVADYDGPYAAKDVEDPTGPAQGEKRVLRGGAFNAGTDSWLRPAFRFSAAPDQRSHAIGFRCAKSLD